MLTVGSRGPKSARVMIVGEAPGETEASTGRPFSGRSGQELERYLRAADGPSSHQCYVTNVVKEYREGNPDPTPEMVAYWTPKLIEELTEVQPEYIIACGKFAMQWFLGSDLDLPMTHGIPHRPNLDRYQVSSPVHAVVLPSYHPAAGFYDDDNRTYVAHDLRVASDIVMRRRLPEFPTDEYPEGDYRDCENQNQLVAYLCRELYDTIAIDTEGVPGDEWSLQVSVVPGTGLVLRSSHSEFAVWMRTLADWLGAVNPVVVVHNAMYDLEMCRLMGLDLYNVRLFDTQYAAYLMRTEPQGLKPLSYRWCGARQRSYEDTVGEIGIEKQIAYLLQVAELDWPKPEPRIEWENDGTCRLYSPQPIQRRAEAIVADYYGGKLDKDGNRTDPHARWRKCDHDLRRLVESALGRMPIGTLADIPLAEAVHYAGRDPDVTLRLYHRLRPELERLGLTDLMQQGMDVYPVFEEMQSNGLLASRAYFENLASEMWEYMLAKSGKISHRYYDGLPFNPASPDQVAALMRRRGLVGEKRSRKTGKVSTAKKSIEHLRYEDEAMEDVIDWREHQKIRDSFANPIIERLAGRATARIRTRIKTTRVASRRISSSDPNLTAIPVRNELGLRVRDGFEAESGCHLGSWDLSQVEMRYMAHISGDPLLRKFLIEGRDPHAETAARIFGIPLQDVKEMEHRYPSKRAGFGIITNITGAGLLDQLRMFGCKGWDVAKCDDLVAEYLKLYKGVNQFMQDAKAEAHALGYVRDVWGHYRYLPGVYSVDKKTIAEAERAASSHKIQGGAQGMIQASMAWLKPRIREYVEAGCNIRWILQIHDELILEFEDGLWDLVNDLVMEGLTEHSLKLSVPVKAKGNYAKTWGKLK